MTLESTKSVPTTPVMSTPIPTPSKNVKNVDDLPKKTRGEKREATDEIVKRKRGSLSSSVAREESSSAPGTPSNKKRKRN